MRFWAPLLAAPLLLSQGRAHRVPRIADKADKADKTDKADGGVGIAIHVGRDGGPADEAPAGGERADSLRREVSDLQARTAALERDALRARRQEQQLQQLTEQLAALRQQLAQGQQQQAEAQAQAQAGRDNAQQAISSLLSVQGALAGGNLDVDAALAEAQALAPPQAQRDLAAARDAVHNQDLYNARAQVAQAIADAQQGR